MIVIGLVGEKGSGKETFSKFLKEMVAEEDLAHIRFSDILKDTLEAWDLPTTRENMQHLAVIMNQGFGEGTLTHAVYQRISKLKKKIIILDGVRWKTDVELLERFKNHTLIYITADLESRYKRLKKRAEKSGEDRSSMEQFLKEEKAPNELLIQEIGAQAEVKIENNGTLNELRRQVENFYQNCHSGLDLLASSAYPESSKVRLNNKRGRS